METQDNLNFLYDTYIQFFTSWYPIFQHSEALQANGSSDEFVVFASNVVHLFTSTQTLPDVKDFAAIMKTLVFPRDYVLGNPPVWKDRLLSRSQAMFDTYTRFSETLTTMKNSLPPNIVDALIAVFHRFGVSNPEFVKTALYSPKTI